MLAPSTKPKKMPKISTTVLNSWIGGVVSALDDGRTPKNGLRSASNTILDQDGVIRPRPSLQKYLPDPVGTVLGRTFEFRVLDGLTPTNWLINLQKVPQNEVQTITITGTPTGGTFTLTYSGQTTSSIAYNAAASDVQAALEALSNIAVGDVVCAGGTLPGTAVTVTFEGALANTDVSLMTSSSSLTGGTSPTITITETKKGGDTAYAYIAKPDDTTWTKCDGGNSIEFSISASGRYFQIADKIAILTGTDTLSYFDITTASDDHPEVVTFTAIDDAAAPTIANNGSTDITTGTTSYTIYYAVTANSTIGQSTGTYTSQAINLQRSQWDKTKNSLKITWTAVTDAQSYNVYCAVTADGDSNPQLFLLANALSGDTTTYVDDGSLGLGTLVQMPTTNSTAGPKSKYGTAINGRLWLWGDPEEPYKVKYGGNYGYELDFSGANGSGWLAIGNGTTEIPAVVWNFRSGQGDPEIKVLTKGLSGSGKRYTINQQTVTLGDQSTAVWLPSEDYGFTGTDSPDALIVYENSSYYPSRAGFKTTGTKPQLQNLLSTDTVSDTITPDLSQISWDSMDSCIGLGFEGRLYWLLPVGQTTNNQIWVLDVERSGAWMEPWNISADDMFLVQDNDGFTHHVILSDNTFYEFSYNTKTSDNGTAFSTGFSTGLKYFSDDGRMWVRLIRAVVEVLRPQGSGNFILYGFTNKRVLEPIGTASFNETSTALGYGYNEYSYDQVGYDDFNAVPEITAKTSLDVPIKVNKDVRYIALTFSSTQPNTDYAISKLVTEEVEIGVKNLN